MTDGFVPNSGHLVDAKIDSGLGGSCSRRGGGDRDLDVALGALGILEQRDFQVHWHDVVATGFEFHRLELADKFSAGAPPDWVH